MPMIDLVNWIIRLIGVRIIGAILYVSNQLRHLHFSYISNIWPMYGSLIDVINWAIRLVDVRIINILQYISNQPCPLHFFSTPYCNKESFQCMLLIASVKLNAAYISLKSDEIYCFDNCYILLLYNLVSTTFFFLKQ